jgi:hypothetical protein
MLIQSLKQEVMEAPSDEDMDIAISTLIANGFLIEEL